MRKIIKVMDNWNFTDQNGTTIQLDLPHTWNNKDGQDGGNDYWRGIGTYEIDLPNPTAGKKAVY